MKLLFILLSLLFPSQLFAQNWADYTTLLQKYVTQSEKAALVDYRAWGRDPLHEKTMTALLAANPTSFNRAEKLTFWINAYNLLTIDVIVKTGETKSIRNQGTLLNNVWKKFSWEIAGQKVTLDAIEHQILRKMNEPRIHFAINCASISCPDLRLKPYTSKNIENELAEMSKAFILSKKGKDGAKISEIFNWFKEDFGDITAFIKVYDPKFQGASGYLPYDWALNIK